MTTSIPEEQTEKTPAKAKKKAGVAKPRAHVAPPKAKAARHGSKTAKILDLLKRPTGVTLTELAKMTGWRTNSVRGFLSGTIGKKMETPVESFKSSDGDRCYRLRSK